MRCVAGRLQGAARSQWLFRWGRSADAVATRNPKGRAFGALRSRKTKKCNKTTGIFVTALRQKRLRRTREESPTGC